MREIKEKKYNILFISPDWNYFVDNNASFKRMYDNLIAVHNHKDFNVIVLQPNKERNQEKKVLKKSIKCYYYKQIRIFQKKFTVFSDFNPFFITKAIKIIKRHKIALIHIDYVFGINILRLLARKPISYNAHNVESIYAKQIGQFSYGIPKLGRYFYRKYIYYLERYAVKFAKNVSVISYIDKKVFIRLYNIPEKKIIVNSIGYIKKYFNEPIKQEEARKKFNIGKDKFVVAYHGQYVNIAEREAVNLISDKISTQVNDKEILFVIAGRYMPHFENKRNLRFLGYVEDLKSFLYSADIAIIPILRGSGIKTKILDYLSALIPIIATKKGAEGHLIENGIHGYIVNNPVDDIVKKILELKNNPKKINKFKSNIKKLVIEKYNWDKISDAIVKKYGGIIEKI